MKELLTDEKIYFNCLKFIELGILYWKNNHNFKSKTKQDDNTKNTNKMLYYKMLNIGTGACTPTEKKHVLISEGYL